MEREKHENISRFKTMVLSKLVDTWKTLFDGKDRLINVGRAINLGYRTIDNTDVLAEAIECLDGMDFIYQTKIRDGKDLDKFDKTEDTIFRKGVVLIKAHEMASSKFNVSGELKEEYQQVVVETYQRMINVYTKMFASSELKNMEDLNCTYLEDWGKLIFDLSITKFDGEPILLKTLEKNKKDWFGDNDKVKIEESKELKLFLINKLTLNYLPSSENVGNFLRNSGL